MKLTATVTDGTATAMTISGAESGANKFAGAYLIVGVYALSSADTAISFIIADPTQTLFSIASGDYTSATPAQQKNEANSNFKQLMGHGQPTLTASGVGSGNIRVDMDIIPL